MTLNYLVDESATTITYMNTPVRDSSIRFSTQVSAMTSDYHVCVVLPHVISAVPRISLLPGIMIDTLETQFLEKNAKPRY